MAESNGMFANGRLRSTLVVVGIVASLGTTWGITVAELRATRETVAEMKATVDRLNRELQEHERLPWHYGFSVQLPIMNSRLDNLESRVHTMEVDR